MSTAEIARLEQASRVAMVSESDAYDGEVTMGEYLRAISPVIGIVAAAVALILVLL
jgi:hypothetical protein